MKPKRIQRKRTKGWRMPDMVYCGHAYRTLECRPFWRTSLPRMRRPSGRQAFDRMQGGAPPAPVREQVEAEQRVSPRREGCRTGDWVCLHERARERCEQARLRQGKPRDVARPNVQTARRSDVFNVWLHRRASVAVRPYRGWRPKASASPALGDGLLQGAEGHAGCGVAANVPSAVRQLQLHQARGARGSAVASCR